MNRFESMSDLIYVKDDVMDKDFCSHLITKFEEDVEYQYEGIVAGGLQKEIKDTTDLKVSGLWHWNDEDEKIRKVVEESMCQYIGYVEKFFVGCFNVPDMGDSEYVDRGYQIQKYNPGGGYIWHQDFMVNPNLGSRMFTFIFYLNDVITDGYTEFGDGTRVRPKAGRVLWFPATWTYVHRGYPPKDGVKYILTGWCYSNNFQDPS